MCARESASVWRCVPYCVSGASHFHSSHDFWSALRRDAPVDPCVARQTASATASETTGACGATADGGRGRRTSSPSASGPTSPSPSPSPAPVPVPREHPEVLVLLLALVTGSDRAPEMESARAMRSPTWTDARGAAAPPVQPDAVQNGSRAERLAPVWSSVAWACPV